MNTNELRKTFLQYFQANGHTIVPTSSLIPANDPTLLFTNAGMVQFKDVFLGNESRPYKRATTAQRCVRAGGKHNDLENVGYTARHHTFFEMLGNFSFGDYFKREAIQFAWKFITEVLKIPQEKLWVTVFREDDEAADIWLKEIGVSSKRFSRCDEKDNFWSMGDTGPCGPCTEIFYDHGADIPGGPPGTPDADGDRYIEIWNLVFMQFNRSADGTLTLLPQPSVDTGMGIERLAAVMQGVHSNYEIDLFRKLMQAAAAIIGTDQLTHSSLNVIADHIRSTAFLIVDGVRPSNEGRGYVLRRIIRRAIRHGHKLGVQGAFFYKLTQPLVNEMGEAYPELAKTQTVIEKVLKNEEEQFANTLDLGMKILEQEISRLTDKVIPGATIFKLYDTYGFPADLTNDIARERGLTLDYAGFETEMDKQRQSSQASSQFAVDYNAQLQIEGETRFTGYDHLNDEGTVTALIHDGKLVTTLTADNEGAVVLDRTPFYAESGGQVGDKGKLFFEGGSFTVTDTQKLGLVYLHHGRVDQGKIKFGTKVNAEVDSTRNAIVLNHSATHLLHAALRRTLGEHVIQKGSLVEADRLRFDFSHFEPLTPSQIQVIERLVNQQIRANLHSHIEFMTPDAAKNKGAMALFGEKYGDEVRVLTMGEFSMELCGGTHVENSGEIGLFKITTETGIASGVRRIEAITGEKAFAYVEQVEQQLTHAANLLKANREEVTSKLENLLERYRAQEKVIEKLQQQLLRTTIDDLVRHVTEVGDIKVVAAQIHDVDINALRNAVDQIKQKFNKAVVALATVTEGKVQIIVGVTKSCTDRIKAGELVNHLSAQVGGKGGGRPDLAQGGGDKVELISVALASVPVWLQNSCESL